MLPRNQDIMALRVVAGPVDIGFLVVEVNGIAVPVTQTLHHGSFSVHYHSSHQVTFNSTQFRVVMRNSDGFMNQQFSARVPLSQLNAHGLFGQTSQNHVYDSQLRYIEGIVDDYAVGENELFGADFVFNLFHW